MAVRYVPALSVVLALASLPLAQPRVQMLPQMPSIRVSGVGKLTAQPNQARVYLGVEEVNSDIEKAKSSVDGKVSFFTSALKGLGVADTEYSTSQIDISKERCGLMGESTPEGYTVSRTIMIKTRKTAAVDKILDQAVKSGVNKVYSVRLTHSNLDSLSRLATTIAVEDAKKKAKDLAANFSVQIDKVYSIESRNDYSGPDLDGQDYGSQQTKRVVDVVENIDVVFTLK
jgi:uncharacterized protein